MYNEYIHIFYLGPLCRFGRIIFFLFYKKYGLVLCVCLV